MLPITKIYELGAAATLAASIALGAGPAQSQDKISLKMGHFLPTVNGMHKDFLEPWARDIESCSAGQVSVEIYPAGTQLGNIAQLYDAVQAGALDVAHGLSGIPAGRFDKTMLMELPIMAKTSSVGTRVLWNLFEEHLADEFPGVKVLALHTTNSGQIHTADKQVKSIEDLAGLRIRTPSAYSRIMVETLGGTPVGLPPTAVYENLERKVIDGTAFTWDTMDSFKLSEVTKYHYDAQLYATTFWFGMNQGRYDSLPENVRACVDRLSGEALVSQLGEKWNAWDKAGWDLVQGDDHEITVATPEERAIWTAALVPMVEAALVALEEKGVSDARDVYAKMKAQIAELEK